MTQSKSVTVVSDSRCPSRSEGDRRNYDEADELWASVGQPTRSSLRLIIVFFLGFLAWAGLAPLAGGAIAPGVISPDGSKKTVQHFEGGIIGRLLVREGDRVEVGQPLIELDNVQPLANHELLSHQRLTLLATRARLLAERTGKDRISFPRDLIVDQLEARSIVQGQRQVFETRRAHYNTRKRVLNQKILQLQEQITGLIAQIKNIDVQIALLRKELQAKSGLLSKGLVSAPAVYALQRMEAELGGRKAELKASIAAARQTIGESELQLVALDAERQERITSDLDGVRTKVTDVEKRLFASADVMRRMVIKAPVSGTILNMRIKTIGGVLQPGAAILDIVPSEEKLLIDARVNPIDVDVVHEGLTAKIQLSAFSTRDVPQISGIVKSISADRVVDENTKDPYFLARVEVVRSELEQIAPEIELHPGMPAEVLIVTGERTFLEYLMEPLTDAIRKSFREV